MSPREFVDVLFDPKASETRKSLVLGQVSITCPLGCGHVRLHLPKSNRWDRVVVDDHKQQHPNSVRCYWSGQKLLALQGLEGVDVTLRKE